MFTKGNLTLFSAILLLLFFQFPVHAQEVETTDTVETSFVYADRNPVAFTGLKRLNETDILKGSAFLGTPDVIKTLQNMPGVSSGMELMSGLYVHGGDGSDNLFLIDEVPLFQVSHLAGLFSSFNTDVIRSLSFYKSGFPSRYGGRTSSVVDIETKDGALDKFGGSFSIGLLDGRLRLNGPIIKGKLSYDIAVRKSWLELITLPYLAAINSGAEKKENANYSLFDTNVNLTWLPSLDDKVNFRVFAGGDWFHYGTEQTEKAYGKEIYYLNSSSMMRMRWGNVAACTNWAHDISEKSDIKTTVYYSGGYSRIHDNMYSEELVDEVVESSRYAETILGNIHSAGLKSRYSIFLNHHHLTAGLEYQHMWYSPSRTENLSEQLPPRTTSNSYQSDDCSIYVDDEMVYGPFTLTAGVRLDSYFCKGESYFRPQLRVSTSIDITKDVIFKASYESVSQYSHLLSSIFLDLPTNLWMPSTDKVKPSDSRQVSAGFNFSFTPHWHMDISGYYRAMDNCLIYSGTTTVFPPLDKWEKVFSTGKGRSYGTEIELECRYRKVHCAAYYTLSWNERKFPDLYPEWFYDRFDNRHKFTFTGTWNITDRIDLNATWNYHSGNRVTMPEHIVEAPGGGTSFLFSRPYNAQMPDYHRLDLSCNFHKTTKRGHETIWNVSIYNVYCRMNPIIMHMMHNESDIPVVKTLSLVPIIPSFSYTIKF